MADREKVIKAIETCYFGKHNCTECELFYVEDCNDKLMRDVLEILKEQEAIPPRKENDGNPGKWASWWYVCGACKREINWHDKFCRNCGKMVKWDD